MKNWVSASINFTVSSSYRVEWALLDPTGTVMVSSTTALGANVAGPRTSVGTLAPTATAPLVPGLLYWLRMNVRATISGTIVATGTETPGLTYLHFPGTAPGTAARPILSEILSVTVDARVNGSDAGSPALRKVARAVF